MYFNSKEIAFILAICISTVTTSAVVMLIEMPDLAAWIMFFISFGSSFVLINILLEFLFFRELRSIYDMFKKIQSDDLTLEKDKNYGHMPLNKIHKEIFNYAQVKQSEINELKKTAVFRRQFLADVSHELKTPIFAAQGFVHTLLDGAIDDEANRIKFLKKAAKNLDGLDALVQDLLTVSHMESGDIKMQITNINVCSVINDALEQLEKRAEKSNVKICLSEQMPKSMFVRADPERIYQVLVNLISNGIKYSNSNGNVMVSLNDLGHQIEVQIEDKGIGIPKEQISRVFERFYRVDKSRSRAMGGTGLGLSIVKHILEAHGSEIKVVSELEKGSVFSFFLQKTELKNKPTLDIIE